MHRVPTLIFCGLLCCGMSNAQLRKFSFSETKMGSPLNIILVTDDSTKAAALATRCYALVDSFNQVFSDYDPKSELSRLNTAAGTKTFQKLSPALWDILLHSLRAYHYSHGAFDITVGPLSVLWRNARTQMKFPEPAAIAAAKKNVGFDRIRIDTMHRSVTLLAGMRLDLGGIAKGWVAEKLVRFLRSNGISSALADAGGDMAMSGAPPGSRGWTIGVNIPETTDELLPKKLLLQNKAVATSGDAYQWIEHDGKKYSHITDPRTGYGITTQRNVTVIADNATDADWLATACSILPIPIAKQLAQRMKAELMITELDKGRIVFHNTEGFSKYWK